MSKLRRLSTPMAVTTPAKPTATPISLRGLSCSSLSKRAAMSTPKTAVAALKIEVRPEGI